MMTMIYPNDFNYGFVKNASTRKNFEAMIFSRRPSQKHRPHLGCGGGGAAPSKDDGDGVLLGTIGWPSDRPKEFKHIEHREALAAIIGDKKKVTGRAWRFGIRRGEQVDVGARGDTNRMGVFRRLRVSNATAAAAAEDDRPMAKDEPQMAGGYADEGDNWLALWRLYCSNSTVHGLKYLTDSRMYWFERFIWISMLFLASCGILYVSYMVQIKFSTNRLATVVESTVFPIYEIPYPGVTICNYNRINWKRVPTAINRFLPNGTKESVDKLLLLLTGINTFEFGSFDSFETLTSTASLDDLNHINLTELYLEVHHRCDELFEKTCWWRNKFVDCCSLFAEQKSEYGICFAFNSETNPVGQRRAANETNYPWRTSNYGDWSGLRVAIRLSDTTRIPNLRTPSGILVDVHHPWEWPNSAHFIPTGTQTTIVIKPSISYVEADVHFLDVEDRECLIEEEITLLGYETLPGLRYLRPNCVSACRQSHMVSVCNCTLDFIYPSASLPQCDVNALKCLVQYDAIFNYEIPPRGNKFFGDDEVGMLCNCMSECELIEYGIEISPITKQPGRMPVGDYDDHSEISLDVHFQQASMVRYRTALVFDWMDLLVSFGGIAGLFLGCSLLSFVEVLLYVILGLVMNLQRKLQPLQKRMKKKVRKSVGVVHQSRRQSEGRRTVY